MQEKDIISNRYLAVNERFAQICNNTLFDGRPLILPEKLVSLDRTEAYIPSDKAKTGRRGRPQASQLYRDILKLYDNRLLILMPGESKTRRTLPVLCPSGSCSMTPCATRSRGRISPGSIESGKI